MSQILTYEEIRTVAEAAAELGIRHIKLTGGEPLVRRGITNLIRELKKIPAIESVTLTTNGTLLKKELPGLLEAGLDAVNISLDTMDREQYR
jgi:cyclic pyranopterin phosphate synthase